MADALIWSDETIASTPIDVFPKDPFLCGNSRDKIHSLLSETRKIEPVIERLDTLGFKPNRALIRKSRERLFGRIDGAPTRELESFFASCNGGRVTKLASRFYRLSEAVDLAFSYADFFDAFSFLPLFVHEATESDPCSVVLSSPLRGYVYWHPHDATPKLLAPSIKSFIRALPKGLGNPRFVEEIDLIYPKQLSKRERSIFGRALAWADAMDSEDRDGQFLRDLALSMPSDGRGDTFVKRCIDCLRNNGIEVENDGYYLFIGPRKVSFHVQYYEKERNRPDFDEFFIDRIRSLRLDKASIG